MNVNIDMTGVCGFVVLLGWGGLITVIGFDIEREKVSQDVFEASGM